MLSSRAGSSTPIIWRTRRAASCYGASGGATRRSPPTGAPWSWPHRTPNGGCWRNDSMFFDGQPALQRLRRERPRLRDQRARVVHLAPGVPQQHAAHPAALEVVDHALPERLLPIGHGLEAGVELAYGFVAQLGQGRVEERQGGGTPPPSRPTP